MNEFLENYYTLITHFVEILAALAVSIYVYKSRDKTSRLFAYYLWITVFVENLALYARLMRYNYDNEFFILIKNSSFCTNHWLYNIRSLIIIVILGEYFRRLVTKTNYQKSIKYLVIIYLAFSIFYYTFSNAFFYNGIPYDFMLRTFLIVFFVCLYYLELLMSDKIINFYKDKHFYISSSLLLWSLIITPLFIFSDYYKLSNPDFIYFRQLILLSSNIVVYLCFTIVFLISFFRTK
jgi:hypothetical protein